MEAPLRHFEPHIILCAVRWYLRFSLSYRDVQELLTERGVEVDDSTIWRWVQRFAPELNLRLRPHVKPTNRCWRVDETYVRVKGRLPGHDVQRQPRFVDQLFGLST